MNIQETIQKIKQSGAVSNPPRRTFLRWAFRLVILGLLSLIFWGFWELWLIEIDHISIKVGEVPQSPEEAAAAQAQAAKVYGSKTGHSYYYSFCGALARVKTENRIEFANAAAAQTKGYVAAKNCKGVQ